MNIYERHRLAQRIQSSLRNVQWPVNAQETDYVARLVEVLPGFIKSSLNTLLIGRQIVAGGAFIHQKPLAHFTKKTGYKDPELGDLLIVCCEKRFSGYCYNAMLLQAKCTTTPFNEMIPNDHQYILYSEWPEFEYKRAGSLLNGKTRSVLPKALTQGAEYLLIDERQPINLLTATVDRPLSSSKLFARTLAALLSFDAGRTFQANSSRDDWSQMILDLLRLSASTVFNRHRSGYVEANRWNGDSAFNYISNLEEEDKTDDDTLVLDDRTDEAHSGIGVICVDLGENRQSLD